MQYPKPLLNIIVLMSDSDSVVQRRGVGVGYYSRLGKLKKQRKIASERPKVQTLNKLRRDLSEMKFNLNQ